MNPPPPNQPPRFPRTPAELAAMSPAMRKIIDAVKELMRDMGLDFEAAWREVRRLHPELFAAAAPRSDWEVSQKLGRLSQSAGPNRNAVAFRDTVNELQTRRRLSYDEAFRRAKKLRPDLLCATNESSPEVSVDGQRLISDWPVAPAVLASLGLPTGATEQQFRIFKLAQTVSDADLSPEIAARILVILTQFQQLTVGMKFDATWEALARHFPGLFKVIERISAANEAAQRSARQYESVNEKFLHAD